MQNKAVNSVNLRWYIFITFSFWSAVTSCLLVVAVEAAVERPDT
jgi:hypothetical protein